MEAACHKPFAGLVCIFIINCIHVYVCFKQTELNCIEIFVVRAMLSCARFVRMFLNAANK